MIFLRCSRWIKSGTPIFICSTTNARERAGSRSSGEAMGAAICFSKEKILRQGALVHLYLKNKPQTPATVEIADINGQRKTTYILDNAEPGITRLVWDFRFDPSAQVVQVSADNVRKQLAAAQQRKDLTPGQKELIQNWSRQLDQFGTIYRKVIEIQRNIGLLTAGGRVVMYGGGIGSVEPGVYAVRLTVNGKTTLGTITVRLDPMQTGNQP